MDNQKPVQQPSVGRVVHVVTFGYRHRPAHIIDPGEGDGTISVIVMVKPTDAIDSIGTPAGSILWYLDMCQQDDSAQVPGTWHWPEYVPAK